MQGREQSVRISKRIIIVVAISALVVIAGCRGATDDSAFSQTPDAILKPLPTLGSDATYFERLEWLEATSIEEVNELGERLFSDIELDTHLSDFGAYAEEFLPTLATLLEEHADELAKLDPPVSATSLHDEYADWHRVFAIELRETAVELEQGPPPPSELSIGEPMSVGESFGFLAVAFYDFLGPTCARLERLAESEGVEVDLQCP